MGKRLEREFEEVRREMEEAATRLGINHPEVHRLSRRLDRLHNQILWERKALMEEPRQNQNRDPLYRIRRYSCYLKETSEVADKTSLPQDSSVVNIHPIVSHRYSSFNIQGYFRLTDRFIRERWDMIISLSEKASLKIKR